MRATNAWMLGSNPALLYLEEENRTNLFKCPFIMSVFSVSVDEGVQSLRDDGAVDGGPTKYSALFIPLLILFIHPDMLSLGGVYRFRVKVSLRIH